MESNDITLSLNQPNNFGIEKIVDCCIKDGRQMFKVQWERTWEPIENLIGCQHFIDEFWSLINKVKKYEAKRHIETSLKQVRMQHDINLGHMERLSEENKAEVQNLIARTCATSVGNVRLESPSNLLSSVDHRHTINNTLDATPKQSYRDYQNITHPSIDQKKSFCKSPTFSYSKPDIEDLQASMNVSKSNTSLNNSTLKYLENFDNPYVKIIVACKKCNKEQSMKNAGNWKQHYLTHVSDTEKPHKCTLCSKAFVRATQLKSHMKQHMKNENETLKMETNFLE